MNAENNNNNNQMSIGNWIVIFLLMLIPVANIVLLFVWGFGSQYSTSQANWAKATLLKMLVGAIFFIIFWGQVIAFFIALFSGDFTWDCSASSSGNNLSL